jgi:hypothetical protein
MRGWIYRRAVKLKELGENFNIGFLVRWGLVLRDMVSKYPVRRISHEY